MGPSEACCPSGGRLHGGHQSFWDVINTYTAVIVGLVVICFSWPGTDDEGRAPNFDRRTVIAQSARGYFPDPLTREAATRSVPAAIPQSELLD